MNNNFLPRLWESIKVPFRQLLLAVYAFLINFLIVFISDRFGINLPEEVQANIIAYGTPITWGIVSAIDKFLHEKGKDDNNPKLIKGITRF